MSAENMTEVDAYRRRRGQELPHTKLNEEQVREIRQQHAAGVGYRRLAADYGVARQTVIELVKRRTWAWVA